MSREFRKFLYRLDRKDYQEALGTISKSVNDLESLTRLSVALEPSRRKRSGGRVIGMLRDLSSSVYRALRSSILCSDSHDVSLGLSSRFADLGYEEDDEKILNDTQFRVAISFATDGQGSERRKLWDEVDIKRHPVIINKPPPRTPNPPPEPTRPKRAKMVAFAKAHTRAAFVTPTRSPASSGKSPKDIKVAVASVTQRLRFTSLSSEKALINSPDTSTETLASVLPLDICRTLKKAHNTRPDCYGHLVDSACSTHCFRMYPLATTINSSPWSIITLDDVLLQKQGLQPLLWLEEKVRLALAVASAVLQLSKTPWLPEPLTKRDVHFFNRGEWQGYQQPFLRRQIPESDHNGCSIATGAEGTSAHQNTLFCLGILLLEVILGSALESMREPRERVEFPGDKFGMIRDSITVHRLLQTQVALINPAYKAVVERCVGWGASQGLDEERFRERVYNGVVAELEAILECTKLA